ncbi:MAG TPA: enoyl-CoA hydratase-related protein [Acidimicrobiales bacterium]|jgi:2-(1,2-epoxy-1,2-dihydrophenyl)acetyl-CoA isomerase
MTTPPIDEQVQHRVERGVAWMTLNRPEAGNSLTPDQRNYLITLLDRASADLAVRAVVITAAGDRHFCTGADLRVDRPEEIPKPEGAPDRAPGFVARGITMGAQRLIAAVLDCEKPVVAAVNGTAAGIGAHLAFASDLVIASETARFIEVFVRRGIAPDGGGAYLLPRMIGMQKAKELVLFGDDTPALEAERLGLVNRVVAPDKLIDTAREWAERLAAGPTIALTQAKRLLNRSLESDRGTSFIEEATAQEVIMSSRDANEGVAAYVERRTPDFIGW